MLGKECRGMKKTETKKPKKVAIRPVNVSSEEEKFIKYISAQMKLNGTRSWYQIHGVEVEAVINSLKLKGILAWDRTLNGYVLTGKELPF
jgi:hypothetical protein